MSAVEKEQVKAVTEFQRPPETSSSLSPLVQAAMNGGLDTEKLRELLEIQKQYEANEARKTYHHAVAAFKDNAPTLVKNKQVSYGTTNYRHASLGYALTEINPALSKYGLSLSWKTRQDGGAIYVTCYLTHEMGHSESTELFGEPDASGQKNKIQQVASTVTYLKRHTAFALLGLESIDADDDGNGAGVDRISEEQQANLQALIEEVGANKPAFLKFFKVADTAEIRADRYAEAVKMLESKRRKS